MPNSIKRRALEIYLAIALSSGAGCSKKGGPQALTGDNLPRVIKLAFDSSGDGLQIKVNQGPVTAENRAGLKNSLEQLSLKRGDIIVVTYNDAYRSAPAETIKPIFSRCEQTGTAIYLYPDADSTSGFLDLPVFHWLTSYEEPLRLDSATFLVDGRSLGKGKDGFMAMVSSLEKSKSPQQPLILGCHVHDSSLMGAVAPFWQVETNLNKVLRGGQRVLLSDMNMAGPGK